MKTFNKSLAGLALGLMCRGMGKWALHSIVLEQGVNNIGMGLKYIPIKYIILGCNYL